MRGDTKTTKHYRKIRQELATMLGYSGDPDTRCRLTRARGSTSSSG